MKDFFVFSFEEGKKILNIQEESTQRDDIFDGNGNYIFPTEIVNSVPNTNGSFNIHNLIFNVKDSFSTESR